MRKIMNLLTWSVKNVLAGCIGLIGVLVAILYTIMCILVYSYIYLVHKVCCKSKDKRLKRRLNKELTELAQNEISLARAIRKLRF